MLYNFLNHLYQAFVYQEKMLSTNTRSPKQNLKCVQYKFSYSKKYIGKTPKKIFQMLILVFWVWS